MKTASSISCNISANAINKQTNKQTDRQTNLIVQLRYDVKVKLTLCLTKHHAMKTYWGIGATLALYGGEWSASRPGRFTPREGTHGTHWKGGWVGPRAILDAVFVMLNGS
jgi:hypothetical protein